MDLSQRPLKSLRAFLLITVGFQCNLIGLINILKQLSCKSNLNLTVYLTSNKSFNLACVKN